MQQTISFTCPMCSRSASKCQCGYRGVFIREDDTIALTRSVDRRSPVELGYILGVKSFALAADGYSVQ